MPLLFLAMFLMGEPFLAHAQPQRDWASGYYRLNPGKDPPFSGSGLQTGQGKKETGDTGYQPGYGPPRAGDYRSGSDDYPGKTRPWGEIPPEWRNETPERRAPRYDPGPPPPRYRDYPPPEQSRSRWPPPSRFPDQYGYSYERENPWELPERRYRDPYWTSPYEERFQRDDYYNYGRRDPYSDGGGGGPWWEPGRDWSGYWDYRDQDRQRAPPPWEQRYRWGYSW